MKWLNKKYFSYKYFFYLLLIIGFIFALPFLNLIFKQDVCKINIEKDCEFLKMINDTYTMKINKFKDIFLNPKSYITNTLIFIHGLGGCSNNFAFKFIKEDKYRLPNTTRLVFLQSPRIYVNLQDMYNNGWYNIKMKFSKMMGKSDNECFSDDYKTNTNRILRILKQEERILKIVNIFNKTSPKLYLGGFSQGCAMSLSAGIEFNGNLNKIFCFSGHLFNGIDIKNIINKNIVIFHGIDDDVIPVDYAMETYNNKKLFDYPNIEIKILKGVNHEITNQEFNVLKHELN